jgi:hypothetical protein
MEDLREKVYECTLAVEAHMICDLLARAGISARVDGEFLAGAGGELPLGSAIKVRVDPARAAEAREVIDEWERLQPPPEPTAIPPRSRFRSPLFFLAGLLAGGVLVFFALKPVATLSSADFNGDGIDDEIYHYYGNVLESAEYDRNADGKIDARWVNDYRGIPKRYEGDDDFDGRFEWTSQAEEGQIVTSTLDSNGDGRPDEVLQLHHGIQRSAEIYDEDGRRVVARQAIYGPFNVSAEMDSDGDGVFERRFKYNRYGEPEAK